MPEDGDFMESFVKSADEIFKTAIDNPKRMGSLALGGQEFADLAEQIVNSINDKPVDLHSALHSIFDGVCRRAMMSARDEVSEELFSLGDKLPMRQTDLDKEFEAIVAKATLNYTETCLTAGVPADDSTCQEHCKELDIALTDKKRITEQDNEKKILELVSAQSHKYEDLLRAKVDEVIDSKGDLLSLDLAVYIEEHDNVVSELCIDFARDIAIGSDEMIKTHIEKFQKQAKDLRARNLERVRLMQMAEAEKKQKFMLAASAVLIIVAVGIDGDPFDELLSVLRLLWFLPIICMGCAGYFFMYGAPPPYAMQAATTVMGTATDVLKHIRVPEEQPKKKED